MIILSLTIDARGFERGFLKIENRACGAESARCRMYVVGCRDALQYCLNSLWKEFLRIVTERGVVTSNFPPCVPFTSRQTYHLQAWTNDDPNTASSSADRN